MRLDHLLSKESLVCRGRPDLPRSGHEESSFSALFNLEGTASEEANPLFPSLKRRSDQAHASFRRWAKPGGGSEAREIRDDEDCTLKTEQRAKDKQGNRR